MSRAEDMDLDPTEAATAANVDLRLVDAIARRVLQLLSDQSPDGEDQLLTVAQVACRFQVHPNWVYANARRLGAVRLGDGPKAPLRFDPARIGQAIIDATPSKAADAPARADRAPRRLPATGGKRHLLPIADA
jgi:hypothetical protein